jgi:cytochrome c biogenesis protein CcdA
MAAVWLGLLTAVSPCPLAANVAAVSYVARSLSNVRSVAASGLFYVVGRAAAYVAIAAPLVAGILNAPGLSRFLQKDLNKVLGPLLIVAGMFLLGLLSLRLGSGGRTAALQERLSRSGHLGSFGLGVLLACAFCPVSAALFFGSLMPLALKEHSPVLLPALYGLSTGLPVIVIALVLAGGSRSVAPFLGGVKTVERWARLLTGTLMIAAGIYYTLAYVFDVQVPR